MDLCNIKNIKTLLNRHGFHFSKSMGQNFLTADWVLERMTGEAGLTDEFGVLEIGPGIGALTSRLSRIAGKVVAVELDRALLPILEETLSDCDNTEIVSGDILKTDIPALLDSKLSGMRFGVCANLPYNITKPVLTKLIDSKCFESITIMIQREVAQRICARPDTSEYGSFSVYVNFHMESELLFDVPPDCFIPQPKVYSTVITLKQRREPPAFILDEAIFAQVVKAAFSQRRKMLINCLAAKFGNTFSKERLNEIIVQNGFDSRIRGESLDIAGFAKIANSIYTDLG